MASGFQKTLFSIVVSLLLSSSDAIEIPAADKTCVERWAASGINAYVTTNDGCVVEYISVVWVNEKYAIIKK